MAEVGDVVEIFNHPKSQVARELILSDGGHDGEKVKNTVRERIQSGKKIRIVFSENSAFEPVIANLILTFGEPVNILRADTKNVGGVAKGEMILEFVKGSTQTESMKQLSERTRSGSRGGEMIMWSNEVIHDDRSRESGQTLLHDSCFYMYSDI